jgi:hypothetical protein
MDPYELFLQQSRSFRKLQQLESRSDCKASQDAAIGASVVSAADLTSDATITTASTDAAAYDTRRRSSASTRCAERAASARQPALLSGPYAAVRRRHSAGSLPQLKSKRDGTCKLSVSSKQSSRRRTQQLEPLQPIHSHINLACDSVLDFGNISVASVRAAYKQSRMQAAAEQEHRRLHVMRRRSTGSDTGLSPLLSDSSCFSSSMQHDYSIVYEAENSGYATAWQQVAAAERAAERQPPAVDHVFDGLVYRTVCMDDTCLWELLQSVKRRLRQGQTLRLACDLAANSGDDAACRQMLSMVYIKSAQHCHDPSIPAIHEHSGQLYLTMQPAARYVARAYADASVSAVNAAAIIS